MSQIENVINGVSVECFDERIIAGKDAKVVIRDPQGNVQATIVAFIKEQQGADGGWYPAVKFEQVAGEPHRQVLTRIDAEAATGGGQ